MLCLNFLLLHSQVSVELLFWLFSCVIAVHWGAVWFLLVDCLHRDNHFFSTNLLALDWCVHQLREFIHMQTYTQGTVIACFQINSLCHCFSVCKIKKWQKAWLEHFLFWGIPQGYVLQTITSLLLPRLWTLTESLAFDTKTVLHKKAVRQTKV